jgi:ADP-ribosylglycohydrolase
MQDDAGLVSKITSVFRAYAAGDAFGVAHEFVDDPVKNVENVLLAKDGWPYGGVSDDTMLTLLTVLTLSQNSPDEAAAKFIAELRLAVPHLRGLGPTTKAALGLEVNAHEKHLVGMTNGAIMRCALVGMAFPLIKSSDRDAWVKSLALATHVDSRAISCAQIAASLFADAIENGDKYSIDSLVSNELSTWTPTGAPISLDPIQTLSAVIYVVKNSQTTAEAFVHACELGGDTDTVAALSGALLTARKSEVSEFESIPWLADIAWHEIPTMKSAIDIVMARRLL